MKRREFLASAAAAATLAGIARPARAARGRVLLLLELAGGNDGLNTLIPYADPAYARLRPQLGIARDAVLALDEKFGLHPSLSGLMAPWRAGELGIVHGVGYAPPNRSHFRSIEIWDSASGADEALTEGWLSRLTGRDRRLNAVALGDYALGPLAGGGLRSIVMNDPDEFLQRAKSVPVPAFATTNRALGHILKVQGDVRAAAGELDSALVGIKPLEAEFPASPIGKQLKVAASLIASGVDVSVIKASHGSFDTHAKQAQTHAQLLSQLGESLAALRSSLAASGDWSRLLVMTYGEFGRRAAENASQGTDHGTAAPHFLLGGRVKGGFYGQAPSLTDLAEGDLKHTSDFRTLYATAARLWLDLPNDETVLGRARPWPAIA